MPDRHALVFTDRSDRDVRTLVRLLRDQRVGRFEVTRTGDAATAERLLTTRAHDDEVLVFVVGEAAPAGLERCQSERLIAIFDGPSDYVPKHGQTTFTGVSARALVAGLTQGDTDGDGRIRAQELLRWLREHAPDGAAPRWDKRSDFLYDVAFVPPRWNRPGRVDPALVVGLALLVLALVLPWLDGELGLALAFGGGSGWPNRVAVLAAVLLALAGVLQLVTDRATWPGVLLAGGAVGACVGLVERWETGALGPGVALAFAGALLVGWASAQTTAGTPARETAAAPYAVVGAALAAGVVFLSLVFNAGPLLATTVASVFAAGFAFGVLNLQAGAISRNIVLDGQMTSIAVWGAFGAFVTAYAYVGTDFVVTTVAAAVMTVATAVALGKTFGV